MGIILKRLSLILVLLLPLAGWAQTLTVWPTTVSAPRGTTQTVTAVVVGIDNKTVTWSTNHGTLVGTNPCVVNEPCTIAVYDATAETATLTATSNVNGSVTATSTITFTASPTPATDHPRLLVTSSMLAGLQAKATSGNPMYQALKNYANIYYVPGDSALWTFSTWNGSACTGGSPPASDQSNSYKEANANAYAFLSMIAPTYGERNTWGCHGRDVWVYMMSAVISGTTSFGGNHWSDSVVAYALTTDWLMAGGYLSSSDLTIARQFLAKVAPTIINYSYGDSPLIGSYNSSSQFAGTGASLRDMGNNYTSSKELYLVSIALTFNDNITDDPALANTCSATRYQVCPDGTAGSLHAYWTYFNGAFLYRNWAHIEDPNVSWRAYQAAYANLPTQPSCNLIKSISQFCKLIFGFQINSAG